NLEEAHFNIHSGPGVLSLPDYYRTPLAITGARASGRVAGDIQTLQIEKLEIDLGDGVGATFAGVARMTEAGPDIRGEGGIVNLSTSALERFWPEGLRQRARRWVVGNISDGICDKAGLAVDVRAAELAAGTIRDDAVVFEFHCRDVTARYWKAMPALTHARGHGRINAKELLITVEEARMGDIALAEGTIKIDLRRPKAQFADITFLANGPTRSVLEILERKPLSLVQRLGLNAAGATGEASVRTRLRVPLKKGRKLSDIGYAVSASLSDFTMDEAFGTFRLDRGELQLTVAPDGVGAVGTVALNGVPASITWRHDFGAGPTHPSRYGMAAVLGDRERAALGLRFAPYVEGATKVELQLAKDRAGGFDVQGTADLAGARLSLAELGWEKPFGQQGAAEFAFRSRPGKAIEIDRFRVTAPEFEATGKASYGAAAQRIKFERVRFGGHDFGADVDLAADGATTIKVNGRVLDLRSIIDAQEGREAKAPRALRLTAALDNLIVSDSFWLKGAKATAVHGGGRWQEMVAVGGLNGGARVDIRMTPDGERYRKLVVSSADAGGTVAATGYLNGVRGGKLVLIARLPEDSESTEPVVGRLSAEDFMLVEAPRMTSVLKHRSIATNDDDAGDSVAFKRFEAPFVMRGEVIEVQRGRAAGLSVGLTIAGTIDRARESLDLSGNIVPAYAINSALGRIPLVGGLLVGRKGEGVFALGYRIQGALKDPKVTVNPLTALAPGVLRRLVEALGKPSADEPTGLDEDGPSTDSHTP
ncbi:MAG: AsmA-like C-terminal domain-containing protein, partial [Alphaproteobacteria bacterium]|nr:AsmA-like C-terminal domain-containing protein [Alphaproteobacteria bacterium]